MSALDDMMTNYNNGDYFGASDNFAAAVSGRTVEATQSADNNHGMVVGAWNQV